MTNNIQGNSHQAISSFLNRKLYKPEGNHMIEYSYQARLLFRFDGEIKSFPDKQKLKRIQHTKPALQQMLKELL